MSDDLERLVVEQAFCIQLKENLDHVHLQCYYQPFHSKLGAEYRAYGNENGS